MSDKDPLPEFDLDRFTPYRLAVAARRVSEDLARQYSTRFGISIADWRVLAHLAHAGDGTSVRDIQDRVALEKYEVSRTAKRLEEKGLIAKSANTADRRLVRLSLTPKGRALMAELLPIAHAYQASIEERLNAAFPGLEAGLAELLRPRD